MFLFVYFHITTMNRLLCILAMCALRVTADFPSYTTTNFDCFADPAVACSRHGICSDTGLQCICSEGYYTVPEVSQYQCNSYDATGAFQYTHINSSSNQKSLRGGNDYYSTYSIMNNE